MWQKRIGLGGLCFLLLGSLAMAQTTGNIDGLVSDDTGAVLPGATVTILSEALLGGSRTAVTNDRGAYRFPSLPLGTYSVQAEMQGFETKRVENVEVRIGQTITVNIPLKVAGVVETVTVVGESPIVDVRNAGTGTSFRNELLAEIPTQRNMYDLMHVSPGMSAIGDDSQGDRVVAFGSNQQSNSWNIDGINVTAPETGSSWLTVNVDNIEEVQVYGVGAPAEYGNHTGAVLNVVTKKGGNEFHGGANFFFQHDSLTDSTVLADPISGESCEGSTAGCLGFFRDVYRDVTGQIGGPIAKDKVWFYGSAQHFRDNFIQPGNDPNLPGITPAKSDKIDVKVTAKIGERHELAVLAHTDEWGEGVSPSPFVTQSANSEETGSNPAWGATLTSVLSDTTLLELKYAGWWTDDVYQSATGSLEEPFIDFTPPAGGPPIYSGGLWYPWDYVTWRQQFNAKVTTYAEDFLKSQHDLRFGVQFSRGSAKTNVAIGSTGSYSFNYYGYLYRYTQDPYQYGGVSRDLGFFIDDTMTVNDRLTLNLGVRGDFNKGWIPDYERLTVGEPSISPAGLFKATGEFRQGVDVVDWKVVSPRLGIAFQPTKDGRTVIRGSFGVYYDQDVVGNWDAPSPGRPTFFKTFFNPETGEFEVFDQITAEDIAVHPDLKDPRTLQYSVGFERQLGTDMSFEAQYVHKDTKDLVGWEILDGVYEFVPFTDPFTGNQFQLLSQIERPLLRKGNDPGNFPGAEDLDYEQVYDGVVLAFEKRFRNRWGLMASYTWSKSEGLIPRMLEQAQFNPFYGNKRGSDPNNFINAYQRLQGDRPHMFRTQAVFRLPGDIQVSANLNLQSGRAHNRQIRTFGLGQGRSIVIMAPAGSFDPGLGKELRFPTVENLDLLIGWRRRIGGATLKIDGTIFNVFNKDTVRVYGVSGLAISSGLQLQNAGEDFVPGRWFQPRRLMVRVGFDF